MKQAKKMVMAWGEKGLELTPESETVEIKSFPVGPDSSITPASARELIGFRLNSGGVPTKILSLTKSKTRRGFPCISVRYRCTPFFLCGGDNAPTSDWSTCRLFSIADATDELWNNLPASDSKRLVRAVKEAQL